MPEVTVRHSVPALYNRSYCEPHDTLATPAVEFELTYPQGYEDAALKALDAAYADLKRQITGMTTIVPGKPQEDS